MSFSHRIEMEEVGMPCPCHRREKTTHHCKWRWAGRALPREELLLAISYIMGMSLLQLPMQYIDGNPVPTIVFHGRATSFHAFVVGLCLSFTASVGAIKLRQRNQKVTRYFRLLAAGAMAVTVAVLLWAVVPAGVGYRLHLTNLQ